MTNFTIATFNCENLFMRYRFGSTADPQDAVKNGFLLDRRRFETILEEERSITAAAIKAANADIIALQEVENLDTLKAFTARFLSREGYRYRLVIDGNDPRLIDVAVLSRIPIDSCTTHQFRKKGNTTIFSRDCLEVRVTVKDKPLSLFVNHFKSMLDGKEETMGRRVLQTQEVLKILQERFGSDPGKADWVLLGDLNDYQPSEALNLLQQSPWMEDVSLRIADPKARWTHFYADKKEYEQLDYLFLSKALAARNPNAMPIMIRGGLSGKAKLFTGPRFAGVGEDRPHASDHCPLAITLKI